MPEDVSKDKERLIQRVLEAQQDFQRMVAGRAGIPLLQLNLTMQQLKVLLVLDTYGSRSSHELTTNLGVSSATMTGIIDRLVGQGLVARREDANDRRVRRIELTEPGRELIERVQESRSTNFRKVLSFLDAEDLRALEKIMRKLTRLADESDQDAGGL